uniref:outer membrane beta-barrel protein n=1 Tax=Thaumasiovibrio occultus TaxID=1891184 RepID=UPI000B3505A6|nr:outer membrane beta-barrel protein [Thaumasiovibrio occultus]
MKLAKLITLSSVLLTSTALASPYVAGPNLYVGGSYGKFDTKVKDPSNLIAPSYDIDDNAGKGFIGLNFGNQLAIEAFHYDFATGHYAELGTMKAKSTGLTSLFYVPVGQSLSLFAKLGIHEWEQKSNNGGASLRTEGEDITYGAGIEFGDTNLRLRAEYEVFTMDDVDLNVTSLGVVYRF